MGWLSYIIARSASRRINVLEERIFLLETEVRDLKYKLVKNGIE